MTLEETLDRLRLARTDGVGPVTYRRVLAQFSSAAEAIDALPRLARSGGRAEPPRVPDRGEAAREADRLARLGATLLFVDQPGYPELLALLADAPSVIAVLGDVSVLSGRCVGLVGARNASTNGCRMAEALATDLASSGLVVVSGLARGIDAAAHRGALHVGRTVACVAGGLDCPYPADHAGLQAQIAVRGAVVAEAGLGVAAQSRHFPRRNRVIAGLSLGVVVVEAALRSGTLITARLAQEAHREIFAVPGSPLDPRSRGSNDLIRQGATLTESAADVLANLPEHGPALARVALAEAALAEAALGEAARAEAELELEEAASVGAAGAGLRRNDASTTTATRRRGATAGAEADPIVEGEIRADADALRESEQDAAAAAPARATFALGPIPATGAGPGSGPVDPPSQPQAAPATAPWPSGSQRGPVARVAAGRPAASNTGRAGSAVVAGAGTDPGARPGAAVGAGASADADASAPGMDPRDGDARVRDAVLARLSLSPTPVDEVVRHCHLSASVVSAVLLELELAGRIETLPGNRVCLLVETGLSSSVPKGLP